MQASEHDMNRTHSQPHPLASKYPAVAHNDAIEWEEMPSFAASMAPMDMRPAMPALRAKAGDFNTAWGVTMPAHLDTAPQPAPFRETIRGLATREMNEPELFKHFFG
jgi:hypothetical protein